MFKSIISADETFYLKKNNSTYQEKNKNRTIETLKPLYSNLYNKIFIRKTLIDYFITDSSFEDNFKRPGSTTCTGKRKIRLLMSK